MKSIAFLFTKAPHGNSAGREGLDAVIAAISITNDINQIALFFLSDGVLQLQNNQLPEKILSRNYIPTFGVLKLYGMKNFFMCEESLRLRGENFIEERILPVKILNKVLFRKKLVQYNCTICF